MDQRTDNRFEAQQHREQQLLDLALGIIERQGVAGLTIDKLVASAPWSKGTIYNHFRSKQDLLLALCNSGLEILLGYFQRVTASKAPSRVRMLGLHSAYLLYAQLHPLQFMLVVSAKNPNLSGQTSQTRMQHHQQMEQQLMRSVLFVVNDALAQGDMAPPPRMRPEQIAFANWSTAFGTIALSFEELEVCCGADAGPVEHHLLNHVELLLDGFGWQPSGVNGACRDQARQLCHDLFAYEYRKLSQRVAPKPATLKTEGAE